ncbi:MAG: S41 family peptidase [Alphaproteobacteria bacterium]|nr:S41 family peptidase [Alphaproteobacteria bacterium]
MIRKAVIALGAAVWLAPVPGFAGQHNDNDTYRVLDLFGDVFERTRRDYVDEVSDETLVENAVNGMLSSLDPHSGYMNPKSYKDMQVQTEGEFGGLGIEVTLDNGWVKVVSPIDDTPASRAGIKPGDYITHIDGKAVLGLTLNEAVDKMRGPANSDIRLTIRREGKNPFDLTLTRAVVKIQSVKSSIENDMGYIRITQFNQRTDTGLDAALKEIKEKEGDKLQGIVLDLRNNPGGLLDQAIAVSNAFLDYGEIVSTRSRRPEDIQRFNAHKGDQIRGLPMVVLINDGSASAAEIVAGALQDQRRAIVVGTRSFGKGSVQTIIPLPSRGAMRLTTARYYTPSGRSIQGVGITPDVVIEQARLEALENGSSHPRSESELRHALRNPNSAKGESDANDKDTQSPKDTPSKDPKDPKDKTPAAPDGLSGEPKLGTPEDYQLGRAFDILHSLSLYRLSKSGN